MNLETNILGIKLKNFIMNSSGIYSDNVYLLKQLEEEGFGAVFTKTITKKESRGNLDKVNWTKTPPRTVLLKFENSFLNCLGISNQGLKKFVAQLEETGFNIPLFASITGKRKELEEIMETLEPYVSGFELNGSCPNTGQVITFYKVRQTKNILNCINKTNKPVIPKLPFYPDKYLLDDIIGIFEDYGIKCVTSMNSIAGAMDIPSDKELPVLSATYGGLSGKAIFHLGLGQVHYIKNNSNLEVIACGGIINHEDALKYLIAGASAVQLGSGLFKYEIPEFFFNEIYNGITKFMHERSIKDLNELKNLKGLNS